MAQAADAAQARAQQLRNEANKQSLKLSNFYGDKSQDGLTINEFLKRFETSATSMNLIDQAEKCNLFSNYLRGPAADTWDNLTFMEVNNKNWNEVKAYFLKNFHGTIDSDAFIHSIHKLQQIKGEDVNQFGHRCVKIVNEHFLNLAPPVDAKLTAYNIAGTAADKKNFTDEVATIFSNKLAKTFFINGVNANIKQQLMNNLPRINTMKEAMEEASILEQAQILKLDGASRIAALANMENFELDEEDITEDELNSINVIRGRYGRQPYKKFIPRGNQSQGNQFSKPWNGYGAAGNQKPNQSSGFKGNGYGSNGRGGGQFKGNGDKPKLQCRYCLKYNHSQLKCFTRLKTGAPMIDEKGVPFQNQNQVHANEQDEENCMAGIKVGAINQNSNQKSESLNLD